jgi:hypothetical protein
VILQDGKNKELNKIIYPLNEKYRENDLVTLVFSPLGSPGHPTVKNSSQVFNYILTFIIG